MPALILLPGLDGTGLLFGPLRDALPANISTTIVSYPGDTPLHYSELLPIIRAALPTDRPFVLLAESFSGPLAIMTAATHPPGLVGLVLCASFAKNPHPYIPAFLSALVRPTFLRLFPRFSQVKALLGGYSSPKLRALTRQALSQVSPAVLAHRIRAVLHVDVTAQLAACTVPILYFKARGDIIVPRWNIAPIRRAHPTLRIIELPAPHMALQVAPLPAAEALVQFLRRSGND